MEEVPMRQAGLFGLSDHLKRLSAYGDPLEELDRIIDFEAFRPTLAAALTYGDGSKGGRPPHDPVAMLKCWFWRHRIMSAMRGWNI